MLEDSDDSESEGSSEPLPTLEQAVKAEPALALSRLAARLGLDYHSIRQNMAIKETLQEMRASKEARGAKRAQLSEGNKSDSAVMRSTKRAATKVSSEPKPTPPPDVPSPKSEVLYIHGVPVMLTTEEEALYYRQKSSPLTEQDQVIWANASLPSGPKVRDTCERLSFSSEATGSKKVPAQRPQEAAELPASRRSMSPPEKKLTKPSYPSTIPFSTTPSPYKRASKMKPHSAVASEDTDLPRS